MAGGDLIETEDLARGRDHFCFAFGHPAEFQEAARAFLAEGLAAGDRVRVVVSRPGAAGPPAGGAVGADRGAG